MKTHKEWADLTIHTELLKQSIEKMEKGEVSEFILSQLKNALAGTELNEGGTMCELCLRPMRRDDTKWKQMRYSSPLCRLCFSDMGKYGCD